MGRYLIGALVLGSALGFFALAATLGPAQVAPHLYHDQAEIGQGIVPAAAAHWPNKKWCRHHNGWFFDHHMHYRSQFWKRYHGRLYHWHKEAYHHWGTPNDHERRSTRCPLHR